MQTRLPPGLYKASKSALNKQPQPLIISNIYSNVKNGEKFIIFVNKIALKLYWHTISNCVHVSDDGF